MLTLVKPQYITDENGHKISVILPVDEYERIIQELEDVDDVKLYDKVKNAKESSIPFDDFLKQRKAK
jgi:ribosome maturation factor RimP